MKLYGYGNNCDDMIELNEVSIMSDISELKKLVEFLENTIKSHSSVDSTAELCHSHLRDWDNNWQSDEPDIIIVTNHEASNR